MLHTEDIVSKPLEDGIVSHGVSKITFLAYMYSECFKRLFLHFYY